ncbi:MAG TPA: DNA-directed RNA polymerase subunit omega [Candidatus Hydrogenedentes bacterium]|nr:DNA-directed RNA polymerase subunit omega [Candidatus Hydrogenedentota bacterium]HQE82795.1 DNA-directed RNA polymerase subunit omega [Candidatus Hydrogenedentota bacterium]HQH51117.1 DNA-directed RNA polymerase subunit omega [Candidatus Hydrogenedentota bacterium]HQM47384.1 DNA-directed RNA polymerase subunit omega [Candidatus Hydrogenedentota bacterium]
MARMYSPEDFAGKTDSLYRLVLAAARRAAQLSKPDARPLVPVRSKKPTVVALEEILEGKVAVGEASTDEEGYFD